MGPFRPAGKKPPVPFFDASVTMDTTCIGVRLYTMPLESVGTCGAAADVIRSGIRQMTRGLKRVLRVLSTGMAALWT